MPHLTSCYSSLLSKEVVSEEFFKGEPLKVDSLADEVGHRSEAPPDQLRAVLHQVVHLVPHPVHRVHRQVAHVVRGAHCHLTHVMGTHHRIPHCSHGKVAHPVGGVHRHVTHPVGRVHRPVQRTHGHVPHRAHRVHGHVCDLIGDDVRPGEHAEQVVAAGIGRGVGGGAETWVGGGTFSGARAGGAGTALPVHRPPHNVPRRPVVAHVQPGVEPALLELGHPTPDPVRLGPHQLAVVAGLGGESVPVDARSWKLVDLVEPGVDGRPPVDPSSRPRRERLVEVLANLGKDVFL